MRADTEAPCALNRFKAPRKHHGGLPMLKLVRASLLRRAAHCLCRRTVGLIGAGASFPGPLALAQPTLPPEALHRFEQAIGNRVEAVSILGGDYAAAGGIYTFRGGSLADLSISKIGGGGEVASPKPMGLGALRWAPVLQGNVGMVSALNTFQTGYAAGNQMKYDTFAAAAGAGIAVYFTDHLSLSPTISGMYGRVENSFISHNANGDQIEAVGSGTVVDWTLDTWSVVPGLELDYQWAWRRTIFEFSSRANFFHTESFESSSPFVGVNGDSTTWENKLDADVPLGLKILGGELHTGGFASRTELFGHAASGLDTHYLYTANGRLVLDFLGKLWAVRWLGLGVSYFWGEDFSGWSAGVDLRLKF
jgi:hypothetical protein